MIRFAKANCDNVVAVINSSNALQLGDLAAEDGELSADAIVWIGGPGSKGYASLVKILTGEVNPSGRTPDIFVRDLTADPTYLNIGDVDGFTGWYAPGLNIHRTAFSGRNFEYYSEDPLLSGKMAARVVSGAGDCGVMSYIKHFALNDNDTNRANVCVWANEQAMREIYLRSFEICVKEARMTIDYIADEDGTHATKTMRACTALMTSYNYIGATFSGGSYALLEDTLRGEWGFTGAIISDMTGANTTGTSWRRDQMVRAGNDMTLWIMQINAIDTTSATVQWRMRDAVHNIAYALANSNAMQGVAPGSIAYYTMSPWAIWLLVANIVIDAFVLAMTAYIIVRLVRSRRHPELYKH